MERQLSIFDFGIEDSTVIHFDNESLDNDVIEIKVEDLDFNDEYTSIA